MTSEIRTAGESVLTGVGAAVPHESAQGHVSGAARYIDDLPLPADALHIAVGYAPVSSGQLRSLNLADVRHAPGVFDVVTASDVPGELDIGAIFPGDPLLSAEQISFHGQPLFAVAARSQRQALQAVTQARFEVEETTAITSLAAARAQNTQVLPSRDWGAREISVQEDPAAGVQVIEGCYHIGGQEHFYLEGHVALALPQDDGGMLVHSSSQHPDEIQHAVAEVLGLPLHMVIVECQRMGGGFGGKESQAAMPACLAALFAARTGQISKCRLPRRDGMVMTGKRHPFDWHYRISFDQDGRLQNGDLELDGNCGHSPDLSGGIVERAMFHATNAYAFENLRVRGHHRRLNQVSHTAFRGFGGPQGMVGMEAALDEIAYRLHMDPLDARLNNLFRPGAEHTFYGQEVQGFWLKEMLDQLQRDADYRARRAEVVQFNATHQHLKKGLALTPVQFGISFTTTHLNQAGALVHLYRDGTVLLNHGGTEMGQGLHTKIKQIVATRLGVSLANVRHTASRTDKVPNASPTAASSGADMNGMAVLAACDKLRQRLQKCAAQHLGATSPLEFAADRVTAEGLDMSFAELVSAAYMHRVSLSATGYYATPDLHFDKEAGWGQPFYYFAYGASASEVVIDTRTGEHRLLRVDILHDAGNSLNPAVDIGQVEGGYVQGLGWLTCEDLVFGEDGRLKSDGPANYKIPTADMCPPEFNVRLYERPNHKESIYRSKAVGEPPLMLPISAWCAIRQAAAAAGNRLPRLPVPATPEAIYWAVQEARA